LTSLHHLAIPPRMTLVLVALGGAFGAMLRYMTTSVVAFPFGTLAVNVVGCFVMGLAFVAMTDKGMDRALLFLMTGLLGGFTTFSAFSLDAYKVVMTGHVGLAALYVIGSVVLSLCGVVAGVVIARGIGL
jgi:CrcB protein